MVKLQIAIDYSYFFASQFDYKLPLDEGGSKVKTYSTRTVRFCRIQTITKYRLMVHCSVQIY